VVVILFDAILLMAKHVPSNFINIRGA